MVNTVTHANWAVPYAVSYIPYITTATCVTTGEVHLRTTQANWWFWETGRGLAGVRGAVGRIRWWVTVFMAGLMVLSAGPAALGLSFRGYGEAHAVSSVPMADPPGTVSATAPGPAPATVPNPNPAPTPGQGVIASEEAASIAREAFAIPEDYEQEGVSYNEYGPANEKSWQLNWRKRTDRGFEHISVTVDARTGTIMSMYHSPSGPEGGQAGLIPLLSEEEARAKAEALAGRLQPKEFALAKLEPMGKEPVYQPSIRGPVMYRFRFVRLENGVTVEPDGFMIAVDGGTGRITEYSFQWSHDLDLPQPEGIITQAEAERIFREKIGVRLAYGRAQKPGAPEAVPEYRLVYGPTPGGETPVIDAFTGKLLDRYGEPVNEANLAARPAVTAPATADVPPTGSPLQLEEKVEPSKTGAAPARTMSREEALARASEMFRISGDFMLDSSSFGEYSPPCCGRSYKIWSFSWRQKADNRVLPVRGIYAEVDAVTGEAVSFHREEPGQPDGQEREVRIGLEEAVRRAGEFIARVRPSLAGRLWRNPLVPQPPMGKRVSPYVRYNIQYQMLANGVPVLDSGLNVGVDPVTGEVMDFWSPREEGNYPSKDGVIDEGQAADLFMRQIGLKLAYLRLDEPYNPYSPYEAKRGSEPAPPRYRLVYMANWGSYGAGPRWVDARSGDLLDWNLNPLSAHDAESLTDIKGHWAEADIKAVVGRGILLPQGGRFSPDAGLSRAEALEALLAVARPGAWGMPMKALEAAGGPEQTEATYRDVRPDSPHYAVVSEALRYGIITLAEEFRPDAQVTREEMAVMIARALGYKALIEADTRFFALPFRDARQVSPWARNAVAMMGSLGVFRPDVPDGSRAGRFRPRDPVTRAQMATLLVRLSRIAGR